MRFYFLAQHLLIPNQGITKSAVKYNSTFKEASMLNKSILLLLLVCGASTHSSAAIITWGVPTDASGNATDIITTGSMHDSATVFNSDTTVNGQLFNGASNLSSGILSFNNSAITVSGISNTTNYGVLPGSGWDSEYLKLVDPGVWVPSQNELTISIQNLIIGNDYLVQIFNPFWNMNWKTEYKDEFGNTSGLLNHGLNGSIAPQFVTGMFTANSTAQSIAAAGPSFAIVGSLQVRNTSTSTSVAEPSMIAFVGLSLLAMGLVRRNKV
jgi:hypothetical protein